VANIAVDLAACGGTASLATGLGSEVQRPRAPVII
jgi:hypothetical protein